MHSFAHNIFRLLPPGAATARDTAWRVTSDFAVAIMFGEGSGISVLLF